PGPEGDGGYAVINYREIDPRYGDMDDFKRLLKEAHDRGLRVYIDFVIAHTASEHEWFEKSCRGEEPYKDYYVWADPTEWLGQRATPNNWKSVFGGSAWTWHEGRQQYYMHHFLNTQPKLNLNKKEVQDAVKKEMQFWLDLGADGFRLDALPFANHDPELKNNPWMYGVWPNVHEDWTQQRFDYSMCQPETIELVARIRAMMDTHSDKRTTLGESIAGPVGGLGSLDIAPTYVDPDKGLDMCYTDATLAFHYDTGAEKLKEHVRYIEKIFPTGGHCYSISNHDSVRFATSMVSTVAPEHRATALKQMMKLLATLPGSISLYQGEELGLPQAHIPSDIPYNRMRDPVSVTRGPGASRDGSRTPMPWKENAPNAGFSTAPPEDLYLPIPESHLDKSVEAQENDPHSMLNFMRDMLAWRKSQPALSTGRTIVLDTPAPVLAFVRRCGEQTLLCAYNLSENSVSLNMANYLGEDLRAELGIAPDAITHMPPYTPHTVDSRAAEAAVLVRAWKKLETEAETDAVPPPRCSDCFPGSGPAHCPSPC
ncbi:MAG TPA: alpha-amylase family glycosyl hydrolase, partial [Alphaproteobacteria bacterium]